MPGKVTIDINLRTVRKTSLLWNRLPTRGTKAVCRALADSCSTRDVKLNPKEDLFGRYTRSLEAAGVTEMAIKKGTTAKEIRKILNILTGRGFGAAARILSKHNFTLEGASQGLNWDSLRKSLVTADYGAEYPIDIEWALRPFQYLYRALRFRSDCKLLDHLARGGKTSNLKRLFNVIRRLDYRDFKEFHQNWDFEMLARLGEWNYYFLRDNRRVNEVVRIAQISSDPDLLTSFAAHPIPAIRAAAVANPNIPEAVIGKSINDDPDQSVREAVPKNPRVVAMLERAANSTKPDELVDLAGKPFPCVRRAAARNPKTPWDSVAQVLSRLYKDRIEMIKIEWQNYAGPCDTPDWHTFETIDTIRYGYVSKSLEIAKKILQIHGENKILILEKLKELNLELHDALVSKDAEISSTT